MKVKTLISGQSGRRSRSRSRKLVRNSETLEAVLAIVECFEGAGASVAGVDMGLLELDACRRVNLVRESRGFWVVAMVASVSS